MIAMTASSAAPYNARRAANRAVIDGTLMGWKSSYAEGEVALDDEDTARLCEPAKMAGEEGPTGYWPGGSIPVRALRRPVGHEGTWRCALDAAASEGEAKFRDRSTALRVERGRRCRHGQLD